MRLSGWNPTGGQDDPVELKRDWSETGANWSRLEADLRKGNPQGVRDGVMVGAWKMGTE